MPDSVTLFEHDLPAGFHYRENFITDIEEQALLGALAELTLSDIRYECVEC